MTQQLNDSGDSCPDYLNKFGTINQVRNYLFNGLSSFLTSRLLGMIEPIKILVESRIIKDLIKTSENRLYIEGGYGEKYNNFFHGNVWPNFAEKEIDRWMKECPDTGNLKQVHIMSELVDTDVSDLTTWQRLFQNYVRLFRVPEPDRAVQESLELIRQFYLNNNKKNEIPVIFFDSSKVLLNNSVLDSNNTITVSRVLETDARGTFTELANGLLQNHNGKVNFILQDSDMLIDLAIQEAQNLEKAYTKVPNLSISSDDFAANPDLIALRHIRLQYGTWIGLDCFSKIFPNFDLVSQSDPMSFRGNIVSEGTDIATRATFIRMPAGTIGLEGLGMWLKPQVSDETRKKIFGEVHHKMEICTGNVQNILSNLREQENDMCEELKLAWKNKANDVEIPATLFPKLSQYYDKCQKSSPTSRASHRRWLRNEIEILGACQSEIRKDLINLKTISKEKLW